MQTMNLYIKPYMARQAIAHNSQQMTVAQLKTAIDADVADKLKNICPQCQWIEPGQTAISGKGLIPNPADPTKEIECPTCGGWGATENPVSVNKSFGTAVLPDVTQP